MRHNLILNTDSYKASHYLQYPPHTHTISSYVESRGGHFDQVVFFGLQAFLKEYLTKPIIQSDIDEAQDVLHAHGLPFHKQGFQHILDVHGGFLPLEIEAIAEGTVLAPRHVMLQVKNTDPACFWLTTYVETALLRAIWYPTTVATLSWHCKQIIKGFLERTSDSCANLPFKLHDFGARGVSSYESAALGGAAHLVNFMGTDTLSGILAARDYYGEKMAGFSIPAAEHSTMTAWGKEHEYGAYKNMLAQFAGEGKLVAVVSDSYDLWHAIDVLWGEQLHQDVIHNGGTIVIRPDSGNPLEVSILAIEKLMEKFGSILNTKGFKELPPFIRVIQGDGVSPETIYAILSAMVEKGLGAENIAFGMGSELLQKVNRDTLSFACKASAAQINGLWRDVYKDPMTDAGKTSKSGRLALIQCEKDGYQTIRLEDLNGRENKLIPVFREGKILREYSFQEVRARTSC